MVATYCDRESERCSSRGASSDRSRTGGADASPLAARATAALSYRTRSTRSRGPSTDSSLGPTDAMVLSMLGAEVAWLLTFPSLLPSPPRPSPLRARLSSPGPLSFASIRRSKTPVSPGGKTRLGSLGVGSRLAAGFSLGRRVVRLETEPAQRHPNRQRPPRLRRPARRLGAEWGAGRKLALEPDVHIGDLDHHPTEQALHERPAHPLAHLGEDALLGLHLLQHRQPRAPLGPCSLQLGLLVPRRVGVVGRAGEQHAPHVHHDRLGPQRAPRHLHPHLAHSATQHSHRKRGQRLGPQLNLAQPDVTRPDGQLQVLRVEALQVGAQRLLQHVRHHPLEHGGRTHARSASDPA
eukprot:scaffold606_cov115-Isochrysis_galbana.AAC.4